MSEYYYTVGYDIHNLERLANNLVSKNYLIPLEEIAEYQLNIEKIKNEIPQLNSLLDEDARFSLAYDYNGQLNYISHSGENDNLAILISKLLPDDILSIEKRIYFPVKHESIYFLKNGEVVTRDGTPVLHSLFCLSSRLCKQNGSKYKISLPIGEEPDKWGTFYLPEKYVYHDRIDGRFNIYFDKDEIDVLFPSGKKTINVDWMIQKYNSDRQAYLEDSRIILTIENLPASCIQQREGYYIVQVPVLPNVSANEKISIIIQENKIDINTGTITLGAKKEYRTGRILANTLEKEQKWFRNEDIKKHYDDYCREIQTLEDYLEQER